jgi:hypothetical protein
MKENESEKNLRKVIEQKITHGDVAKKTRWYFIVRRIIIITGGILALSLAIYFGSFLFFLFNDEGIGFLTDFGWEGRWEILSSLPWIIIILIGLLIATIELVGWRFTRLYRQPFIYSILGVLVIVTLAGTLLERTHIHRALLDEADQNRLPIAGYFYHQFGHPTPPRVHFGTVLEQKPDMWRVMTREGSLMVIITSATHFPRGNDIAIQDHVLIFGPLEKDVIIAHGIRKINPDMMPRFYIKKIR